MTMLKGLQANRPRGDAVPPAVEPNGPLGPECTPAELVALNAGYVRTHTSFPGLVMSTNVASPAYVASITAPISQGGAGVKVIPYVEPGSFGKPGDANAGEALNVGRWIDWVDAWIAAYSSCDTFEWINEPDFKEGLGGGQTVRLNNAIRLYRVVLPRFRLKGKKLLLCAASQLPTIPFLDLAIADNQQPPGGTSPKGVVYDPGLRGSLFTPDAANGGVPVAKDGVCIHSYAGAVTTGAPSVVSKFDAARAKVPSTIGIWMTEVGWGVDGTTAPNSIPPGYDYKGPESFRPWVKSAAGQATLVDQLFDALKLKEPDNLKGVSYFIWKDYGKGDSSGAWAESYGLRYSPRTSLTASPNSPKPSRAAFAAHPASWGAALGTAPVATTTFTVTNITQTGATVSGTVNPSGLLTNRFFDWGLSASYGASTGAVSVGSGNVAVPVSYLITGLLPGQTYHFQCRGVNSAGVGTGADRTFTTSVVPLPPSVTTGAATGVTIAGATLNGSVNPNAVSTAAYFEYGPPNGAAGVYGSRTPATDINCGSGSTGVAVSAPLTGLTIGATYHYRLRAQNAQGLTLGLDKSFIVTPPAVPDPTAPPTLPSLAISVELTTADGRTYRFDPDASDPANRPYELQFSTAAGDGFAEASCVVYRPIGLDWPDLALLTKGKFIGADAQTAYEGRVAGMPRSVDDTGEKIQISFAGLMSSARDRPFSEIYCERSTENWKTAGLSLRLAYATAQLPLDLDYVPQVDVGSLSFKGTTRKEIQEGSQGVLIYQAPSGCKVAAIQYRGDDKGTAFTTRCDQSSLYSRDTDPNAILGPAPDWDVDLLTMDTSTMQEKVLVTPRRYIGLRLRAKVVLGHTPGKGEANQRIFREVCIYGDHSAPRIDNENDPDGVYASDVMADIIDRFCPLLDSSELTPTATILEQVSFDTPTMPFDAFTLLNGYSLWLLGAYEGGKVMFKPADLTKADWEIRTDDLGVSLDLHGDTTDQFGNGCVVSYSDVAERSQVLWPPDHDELRDDDPDNPANIAGIELWTMLELSNPVTRNGALRLGEVALAEFNRPKSPGTVTVASGYVPDSNGNLQPAHKVRYGQTLSIIDLPNESPRLITATSWNEDGSLQITLEQPPTRVDAVLARLSLSQQVAGIG